MRALEPLLFPPSWLLRRMSLRTRLLLLAVLALVLFPAAALWMDRTRRAVHVRDRAPRLSVVMGGSLPSTDMQGKASSRSVCPAAAQHRIRRHSVGREGQRGGLHRPTRRDSTMCRHRGPANGEPRRGDPPRLCALALCDRAIPRGRPPDRPRYTQRPRPQRI